MRLYIFLVNYCVVCQFCTNKLELKYNCIIDWRKLLIVHWTDKEQKIIKDSLRHIEKNIFLKDKDKPYNIATGETADEYFTRLKQLNAAS